jgi:hypothetical protein
MQNTLFAKRFAILVLAFFFVASSASATVFEIIALPDTQYYSSSSTNYVIFNRQTQWIADNKTAENIVFVTQLGDITDNGTNTTQWNRADAAMDIISNTDVVPYSVTFGNHDLYTNLSTGTGITNCQNYFGASRYAGKSWFGGAGGTYNLSSYQTFTAGGLDFLHLNVAYSPDTATVNWAKSVLAANPTKRTIISTHAYLNTDATLETEGGTTIWNNLVYNYPQVGLVLCGHNHGEARLVANNVAGTPVYQILADYQSYANGGNGFLRKMIFDTSALTISVQTYSPYLGQYETDANSQFTYSNVAFLVPEPSTWAALSAAAAMGLLYFGLWGRKAKKGSL